MSVREAASYIGISQRKFRELIATRCIRKVRIGSRIIVRRKDIDSYLESKAS